MRDGNIDDNLSIAPYRHSGGVKATSGIPSIHSTVPKIPQQLTKILSVKECNVKRLFFSSSKDIKAPPSNIFCFGICSNIFFKENKHVNSL